MKKIIQTTLFVCAGCLTIQAATTTWTGSDATDNWSADANWDNGVPGTDDSALMSGSGSTVLDSDRSVSYMEWRWNANDMSVDGNSTLTISGGTAAARIGIEDKSTRSAGSHTYNSNVAIDKWSGGSDRIIKNSSTTGRDVIFNGSLVGLNGVYLAPEADAASGGITFNGMLDFDRVTFRNGSFTVNNTIDNQIDVMQFIVDGGYVSVNTASGVDFLGDAFIQFKALDSVIEFNSADVLNDLADIRVDANKEGTLKFNANEEFDQIDLADGSTLTMDLGADVTDLIFNIDTVWDTGVLVVTNFRSGVIGLSGYNASNLTQVVAYDTLGTDVSSQLTLDENDYLVAIPEPGTVSLLLISSGAVLFIRRRIHN